MSNYPVVEQVNLLVGNLLVGGERFSLPGVGSLHAERRPARQISRRMVQPPFREILFEEEQSGISLVEHIARIAKCDEKVAKDVYDRWLLQTLEGDTLTIGGVGVLRAKKFKADESFERRLNPQGRTPVRIQSRGVDWVVWCGAAAIAFAVLAGGYYWMNFRHDAAEPVVAKRIVPVQRTEEPQTTPGQDSLAADPTVASAEPKQSAARSAASASTVEAGQKAAAHSQTDPVSLTSGRKYVVLGVFGSLTNARRVVEEAEAKHTSWDCGLYRFGNGKILVAAFSAEEETACRDFIRREGGDYPDMWIYSAR